MYRTRRSLGLRYAGAETTHSTRLGSKVRFLYLGAWVTEEQEDPEPTPEDLEKLEELEELI